jgi:hypothetical protein
MNLQKAGVSFFHLKNDTDKIYDILQFRLTEADKILPSSNNVLTIQAQNKIISHAKNHKKQIEDAGILQWFILIDQHRYWSSITTSARDPDLNSSTAIRLSAENSVNAIDSSERTTLLKYLFKQHVSLLYDTITFYGRQLVDSNSSSQKDIFDTAIHDQWLEQKNILKSQILDLERAYSRDLPLSSAFPINSVSKFLFDEIDHQDFVRRTNNQANNISKNIELYLDMVWKQYQLENVALTIAESERLSEALVRYQINHMDSLAHDPNYQFLNLVAGGLSMPTVERLLNDNPFSSETFVVGGKNHNTIQKAVQEFLLNIEEDDPTMDKNTLKMNFIRTMTNILVSDPESSGRYTLLPAVQTHRDKAYYAVLTKYNLTENDLPMSVLIEHKPANIYFAELVVSMFIKSGVINPKRWMPKETNRRTIQMTNQALFNIGRVLNIRKKSTRIFDM